MSHWISKLTSDEGAVLAAAVEFSLTNSLPELSKPLRSLADDMTHDLAALNHDGAGHFALKVPPADVVKITTLFNHAFAGETRFLKGVFEEENLAFFDLWPHLCTDPQRLNAVEEKIEQIGHDKGWFVQQAEDEQWYYKWFHGDPDAEGEYATELEAWLAASRDDSQIEIQSPNAALRALERVMPPDYAAEGLKSLERAGLAVAPAAVTNLLKRAVTDWPQFDDDDEVNGADMVEWFGQFFMDAKKALGLPDAAPSED